MKAAEGEPDPTQTIAEPLTLHRLRGGNSAPVGLSTDALVELLGQVSFLRGVAPGSLRALLDDVPLRRYSAGEVVIRQGEFGHSVFVLLDGTLVVEVEADGLISQEVARINVPGSTFGEGAVVGRRRRSATIRTLSPSALLELSKTRVERLDKTTDGNVLPALAVLAELRELSAFIEKHRFFSRLSVEGRQMLKAFARLHTYARGEVVFRAGDPVARVHVVKSGAAELVTENPGKDRAVVNYMSVGDAIGVISGRLHRYSLVSRGHLQLLELEHERLRELPRSDLEVWSLFRKDSQRLEVMPPGVGISTGQASANADFTSELYVQGIIADGAQEGLSVLTIDLDTCIRCGNCVRACQSRHGHARFTRRGEKLVRRSQVGDASRHQAVLLPSSCRHCVDPVCMIDCPTGAIHRTPSGEVVIEQTCIGCSSCANRCPWDNITMVEMPRLVGEVQVDRLANKCDLCEGYDEPNCVHNCPTGAILRVAPASYYPELRDVLGRTGSDALPRTEANKEPVETRTRRARLALVGGVAAGVVSAFALYRQAGSTYSPWSSAGITLGVLALLCLIGALALSRRRRWAGQQRTERKGRWPVPTQGGSFLTWARIHVALGFLFPALVLFHSGARPGGALTSALLLVALAEAVVGVFGLLYGKWMPRVMTRLEGSSQVEEDVLAELERRRARLDSKVAELEASGEEAFDWANRWIGGRRQRLLAHLLYGFGGRIRARQRGERAGILRRRPPELDARLAALKGELRRRGVGLMALERRTVDSAVEERLRIVDLGVCCWLYDMRRAWLGLHIVLAILVSVLTVGHVGTILLFLLGGRA